MTDRDKADEKALDTVVGITNQLITLGTAVVTVLIGVIGLFKSFTRPDVVNLTIATGLEFGSIVFGLLTHGAIAAALDKDGNIRVVYKKSVRTMSILQWAFFLLGLVGLLWTLYSYHPPPATA